MLKKFPNAQQPIGFPICGPVSLQNIYTYYGDKISLTNILSDLGISSKAKTYLSQLAIHLLQHTYETVLVTSDTFSLAADWKNASHQTIVSGLEHLLAANKKSKFTKNRQYLLAYLKGGGTIHVTDLSVKVLDGLLDRGYILLVVLEDSWLWGKRKIKGKAAFDPIRGITAGHFVVVFDKNESSYIISDPYPTGIHGRNGIYTVSKDTLLVSCIIWGAEVLAVKK